MSRGTRSITAKTPILIHSTHLLVLSFKRMRSEKSARMLSACFSFCEKAEIPSDPAIATTDSMTARAEAMEKACEPKLIAFS